MNSFIKETWLDYLKLLDTVVPPKTKAKFVANKKQYITIAIIVIALELIAVGGYFIYKTIYS